MPVSISVRNLTASDLTISDLGLILTASADTDLTRHLTPDGVRFSNDLTNSITADQALIIDNGNVLTKTQSLIFMSGGGLVSETLTIIGTGTVTIASGTNTITISGGSGPDNFSYNTVASGITIDVPLYQQMIYDGLLDVQTSGLMTIEGMVVAQDPIAQSIQIQQNLDTVANTLTTLSSSVVRSLNSTTGDVIISGVNITVSTADQIITISGSSSSSSNSSVSLQLFADQFLTPTEADWAVNSFSTLSADTTNSGILVRTFDDTTEEGVGFALDIPSTASTITLKFRSRAETAPAGTRTVGVKLYVRSIPDNAAISSWQSTALTDLSFPTNTNWQYNTQVFAVGALNVTAGSVNQFELTRVNPTAGTELTGDWDLMLLTVELS